MPQPTKTRFNFTEAAIAALPFADKGKRYIVYDTGTKNLILRVGEKTKIYYFMKKVSGRVIYARLGDSNNTSIKTAREGITDTIKITNAGKNPNDEKKKLRQDITVKEFFDDFYFPNHSKLRKTPDSQDRDESTLRLHISKELQRRRMQDIARADMERLHNTVRKNTNSIYAANCALKLMRQMFNKAIDWGLPIINPAARIKIFKEVQRDRFLQPEELPLFFDALEKHPNTQFKNFIKLCLFVGQRRCNMQALRWSDINFERGALYIEKTKTGKPQVVPLPQQAIDILQEMYKHRKSEWLFPSHRSQSGHLENPQMSWRPFVKGAGLENLRMHDLRRTFASYQAITGSSNEIIGKSLGDESPAVIPIYARMTEAPVRQSIQNAADAIFPMVAPKQKGKK